MIGIILKTRDIQCNEWDEMIDDLVNDFRHQGKKWYQIVDSTKCRLNNLSPICKQRWLSTQRISNLNKIAI